MAVAAVTGARGRTPTREFLRLASHFLFGYRFCRVRRPNEKGHVEAMVKFARRNFLVPVPAAESWEALNAALEERCRRDLARRVRGKDRPKGELLADERSALRPPPGSGFEPRRVELADANSLSLVRFDSNDYSVPTAYAHHPITIVGGLDEVRLVCRDRLVARHRRQWGKEHVNRAGDRARKRFLAFFTATIRNGNTRMAYARAVGSFFEWCRSYRLELIDIEPIHVAAYIERHPGSPPTVKQHLAAVRMLFDWLVTGQVLAMNPAASVRGPRHVVKRGKTPVLDAEQARQLLDSIDTAKLSGLRDRALIAVMVFSFARVAPREESYPVRVVRMTG